MPKPTSETNVCPLCDQEVPWYSVAEHLREDCPEVKREQEERGWGYDDRCTL